MVLGLAGMAGATAWWYLFFEQMLGQDVKRASECFYSTTDACSVGNLFGGAVGNVPAYSPVALWVGATLTLCGIMAFVVAPRGK